MLYWFKLFILFFFCIFFSFIFVNYSILFLLLHSELLIITLFIALACTAISFDLNYSLGIALCYLIIGGLEISLNLLLLVLNKYENYLLYYTTFTGV